MSLPPLSSSSDATISSSSSSSSSTKSRVPAWLPISAFIGTSLALAIPIFMIRRQKGAVLRTALKNSDAPPPRRTGAAGETIRARTPTPTTKQAEAKPDFSSPGTGELLSAMSAVDTSTALYAGKAFAIATGLVTIFGVALTVGVKTVMGVEDAKEFGQRMRAVMSSNVPSLSTRIHRAPETDEERRGVYEVLSPGAIAVEEWTWEKAETRLNKAYEEGGFPLWAKAALREMEAERKVAQAKREKEELEKRSGAV